MRLKLFPKFYLIIVLIAVIPAAIVGIRTININRIGMQDAILEIHTNLATSLAESTQDYLLNIEREIEFVLETMSTQATWQERQTVLQSLLDTNESFASVSVVNKDRKEILKAYNPALIKEPKLLSHKNDDVFKEYLKSPKVSSIGEVKFEETYPYIDIIYPLTSEHSIYTTINLKTLS